MKFGLCWRKIAPSNGRRRIPAARIARAIKVSDLSGTVAERRSFPNGQTPTQTGLAFQKKITAAASPSLRPRHRTTPTSPSSSHPVWPSPPPLPPLRRDVDHRPCLLLLVGRARSGRGAKIHSRRGEVARPRLVLLVGSRGE